MILPSTFNTNAKKSAPLSGIVVVDDYSIILSHNEGFAEICGVPADDFSCQDLRMLLELGESRRDGRVFQVRVRNSPLRSFSGVFQRFIGTSATRALLITELAASTPNSTPTAQKEGGPSDFTYMLVKGLAHKMNNVLTIFHGYSSLFLAKGDIPEDLREGLKEIKNGAVLASHLIERTMLAVKQGPAEKKYFNLLPILKSVTETVVSERRECTPIEMNIPAGLPQVVADDVRLKVALMEVIRNACQAADSGGTEGVVSIHAERVAGGSSQSGQICITITDDGQCHGPEYPWRVFEPFFTTKKGIGCLGIGLIIARNNLEQMKGEIEIVKSDINTEVRIYLPAVSNAVGDNITLR